MLECRYKGLCRLEFGADFDVCYPCVGDGADTCFHYEPMPDVKVLTALADEMDGMRPGYVIARDGARNLAARIREALGATDG